MALPQVGEIWESVMADGRLREAVVEGTAGRNVRLRFLDDNDLATVEAAALQFLPGSGWRRKRPTPTAGG